MQKLEIKEERIIKTENEQQEDEESEQEEEETVFLIKRNSLIESEQAIKQKEEEEPKSVFLTRLSYLLIVVAMFAIASGGPVFKFFPNDVTPILGCFGGIWQL